MKPINARRAGSSYPAQLLFRGRLIILPLILVLSGATGAYACWGCVSPQYPEIFKNDICKIWVGSLVLGLAYLYPNRMIGYLRQRGLVKTAVLRWLIIAGFYGSILLLAHRWFWIGIGQELWLESFFNMFGFLEYYPAALFVSMVMVEALVSPAHHPLGGWKPRMVRFLRDLGLAAMGASITATIWGIALAIELYPMWVRNTDSSTPMGYIMALVL